MHSGGGAEPPSSITQLGSRSRHLRTTLALDATHESVLLFIVYVHVCNANTTGPHEMIDRSLLGKTLAFRSRWFDSHDPYSVSTLPGGCSASGRPSLFSHALMPVGHLRMPPTVVARQLLGYGRRRGDYDRDMFAAVDSD